MVDDPQPRALSLNDQLRTVNQTINSAFFRDLSRDLQPVSFLPVHTPSISFFYPAPNALPDKSIVLFDRIKQKDGIVFFSEPLTINSGLLIQILRVVASNDESSVTAAASAASTSTSSSSHLQLGLTNCDIKSLVSTNNLPLSIGQINQRSEFWIIQDFKLGQKRTIDQLDEFLFLFTQDGVIEFSQNNSKCQDFIHLDSSLSYYPFLIFTGDIVALRSMGYVKSVDRYRSIPRQNSNQQQTTMSQPETAVVIKEEPKNAAAAARLSQDCTICFDYPRDTVLIPCGHICLCYTCAKELHERRGEQCKLRIDTAVETKTDLRHDISFSIFRSYLSFAYHSN